MVGESWDVQAEDVIKTRIEEGVLPVTVKDGSTGGPSRISVSVEILRFMLGSGKAEICRGEKFLSRRVKKE